MADEPRLIGTGRTPSEQDLFDQYMLSFITLREYLKRTEEKNGHRAQSAALSH